MFKKILFWSYGGQVPQTGLFSFEKPDEVEKFVGREVIFVTHHPDKSWLKEFANRNILLISVTLEVSQFPISWLKAAAL